MSDFVLQHRLAFTANLLRRLSDRIVDECDVWLAGQGFTAPGRTASTLMLLLERGPTPITEIAAGIGFSHPFVVRLVESLEALKFVDSRQDPRDGRRRLVGLTPVGVLEAERIQRTRDAVGAALAEVLEEAGVDLLADIETVNRALDRRSLDRRLAELTEEGEP